MRKKVAELPTNDTSLAADPIENADERNSERGSIGEG
jgi:hypothetical protein